MSEEKKLKKLTLTEMRKQDKKLDGKTEKTIELNGEEFVIKIDNHFRRTKQHKVLDDLIEFISASEEDPKLLGDITPYMSLLIIKYFTDINISDDINDAMEILYTLIDLEILDKIINSMPEDQVIVTMELLTNTMTSVKNEIENFNNEVDSIYDDIENQEIKDMIKREVDEAVDKDE